MCGLCSGQLKYCPACGSRGNAPVHASWEDRLDQRRHQGSHMTPLQSNTAPKPVRQGNYVIDNGGFKGGAKYSRAWNSKYDGPGKGTW